MRYKTSIKLDDLFPPRGDGCCCRCDKLLTGKQRRWCSDQCGHAAFNEMMLAKGSSTYIRKALLDRDKGICADCGADTEKMKRIREYARISSWCWRVENGYQVDSFRDNEAIFNQFERNGNFWEADHIVEVVHGGAHALDNLQTLCVPCHKEKTRKMIRPKNIKKARPTPLLDHLG